MQRYFLNSTNKNDLTLDTEQIHHIVKVMRMRVGNQIAVVLANQTAGIAEITAISDRDVTLQWVADDNTTKELNVSVTIACGLPKGDKLEWIVQKATELGAYAFQPFEAEWSVVKWDSKKQDKKIERLQKIAQEAAEQSHRTLVPKVHSLINQRLLVEQFKQYSVVLVAYEEEAKINETARLKSVLQQVKPGENMLVIFGPEGGLSPNEVDNFEQAGAILCGLGPRILRAETAPLYVLSACSYELELH